MTNEERKAGRQVHQKGRAALVQQANRSGNRLTKPISKEHDIFVKIDKPAKTMCTNQTVAFPVTSIKGNRYVMVAT